MKAILRCRRGVQPAAKPFRDVPLGPWLFQRLARQSLITHLPIVRENLVPLG